MKRTELKRRKGLGRGKGLKRGSGLKNGAGLKQTGKPKSRSAKTAAVYRNERIPLVKAALADRPRCQLRFPGCWGEATTLDEIKSRGRGGSITNPANCVPACGPCNTYKEDNPIEAYARGLSRHFWEDEPDGR